MAITASGMVITPSPSYPYVMCLISWTNPQGRSAPIIITAAEIRATILPMPNGFVFSIVMFLGFSFVDRLGY